MKSLLGKIKIIQDNLKIIHRNLIGPGWQTDHPKFAEYYDKIADLEDDIAEMIIMFGEKDMNITEAVPYYKNAEVKKYTIPEAYTLAKKYFNDILDSLLIYRETVPCDCQSELDTWVFWLRKEANYKIAHTLKTL